MENIENTPFPETIIPAKILILLSPGGSVLCFGKSCEHLEAQNERDLQQAARLVAYQQQVSAIPKIRSSPADKLCHNEDCDQPNPRIEIDRIRRSFGRLADPDHSFQANLASSLQDPNVSGHGRLGAMLDARQASEPALHGHLEAARKEVRELVESIEALKWNVHIDRRADLLMEVEALGDELRQATAGMNMASWRAAAGMTLETES